MNEIKAEEENLNNGDIEAQNPTFAKTNAAIEKDEVKIDFINNNEETKVIDCDDAAKESEVNLDNDGKLKESTYVAMAFAGARPNGLLVGRTPQSQEQTPPGDSPQSAPTMQQPLSVFPLSSHSPSLQNHVIIIYTPQSRNRFIKRILSLVFIMLLVTASFVAFSLAVPDVKEWFRINTVILIFPILLFIMVINYAMTWSFPCTRHPPGSIICLVLTVISMSLLSALLTSYYSTEIILYAFIATTAVVFVCIILACTDFDFTSYLLYVIVLTTAFFVLAAIIIFIMVMTQMPLKPAFLGLLIFGTLLQVLMLTMNLQMIIGGKTIELNEQDYALGAYMVYMSIIDIFLKMVYIIGISRDL